MCGVGNKNNRDFGLVFRYWVTYWMIETSCSMQWFYGIWPGVQVLGHILKDWNKLQHAVVLGIWPSVQALGQALKCWNKLQHAMVLPLWHLSAETSNIDSCFIGFPAWYRLDFQMSWQETLPCQCSNIKQLPSCKYTFQSSK